MFLEVSGFKSHAFQGARSRKCVVLGASGILSRHEASIGHRLFLGQIWHVGVRFGSVGKIPVPSAYKVLVCVPQVTTKHQGVQGMEGACTASELF